MERLEREERQRLREAYWTGLDVQATVAAAQAGRRAPEPSYLRAGPDEEQEGKTGAELDQAIRGWAAAFPDRVRLN